MDLGRREHGRQVSEKEGEALVVHSSPAAPTDLGGVEWGLASPLVQVLIHVSVISAQHGIQLFVVQVESIHQGHGVGPQLIQELFNVSRNLGGLRHCQQSSLQKQPADRDEPEPSADQGC